MKTLLFSALMFVAATAGATDYENSCIWKGEEYLKKAVLDEGTQWVQAVYNLYAEDDAAAPTEAFEGVGSCRFIPRNLGATAAEAIKAHVEKGIVIIPTKAYLTYDGAVTKVVIPSASYAAGTNYLFVQKDFYNSNDKAMCDKQMEDTVTLGQSSSDLGLKDAVAKKHSLGGVAMLINENEPSANYLGICHFHSF